jgi:hypothetical protein
MNVSKSSDPDRLNDICVAKSVTKPRIVKHRSIHMNDGEFSDIEISERSKKGNIAVYAHITVLILMLV